MRVMVALLTILFLGACGSMQSRSEQGFIDQAGWRHQQAIMDANAIVAGMNQARAQAERLAKRAQ